MSIDKKERIDLEFHNVGGFEGEQKFTFEVGKLHEIRGANTAGKSSLLKALVAPLSIPQGGDFKFEEEAELFGIKPRRSNIANSFVNSNFDIASSNVKYKDNHWKYLVKKDGTLLEVIPGGNDTFLLVGVLSRNTKIYQQITRGNWEFKWFIDELSAAKKLDSISNAVTIRKREIERILIKSRKSLGEKEKLSKEIDEINEDLVNKMNSKNNLREKTKDIEALSSYRADLTNIEKVRAELENSISETERQLKNIKENESTSKNELSQEAKDFEIRRSRFDTGLIRIDEIGELSDQKADLDAFLSVSEKNKAEIATKRDETNGIINLLTMAMNSLKKESPQCPLCNSLDLNHKQLMSRLTTYRKEYSEYHEEVFKIIKEQDERKSRFEELKVEKEKLERYIFEIKELNAEYVLKKRVLEGRLNIATQDIEVKQASLTKYRTNLKSENEKYKRIMNLSKEGEEIFQENQKLDMEIGNLGERLSIKEEQLKKVYIEYLGHKLNPEKAIKTFNFLKSQLEKVEEILQKQANDQRREAQKTFNASISDVLKRLKFKDLGEFLLNSDYLLTRKVEEKLQDMESLSESEKVVLAIVLLLSAKKVYYGDIPLFIIDDVYNDLDDEKQKLLTEYLIEIASNERIAIVYTCLDDHLADVEVTMKERS